MPILAPWDLVIANPVPASVQWWALGAAIAGVSNLAVVNSLKLPDLGVQVEYGDPAQPQAGRLAWRMFTALVFSPEHEGTFPYAVGALAFVETDGGDHLVGVFNLSDVQTLAENGKSFEIKGFLQVTKYQ